MGFKIALSPFKDTADGSDWDEQSKLIENRLTQILKSAWPEVRFSLHSGIQGTGADFPVLILQVLTLGSAAFFGIPKLHKKIKETLHGWKEIWADTQKFLNWLKKKEPITRYSIEVAFLMCLSMLSGKTDVNGLELVEAKTFLGASGFISPSFENTEMAYYLFILREDDRRLFVHCIDEGLKTVFTHTMVLHPIERMLESEKNG